MDIYIAQRQYNYEGFEIIGVFNNLKMALLRCKEDEDAKEDNMGNDWHVTYHRLKEA